MDGKRRPMAAYMFISHLKIRKSFAKLRILYEILEEMMDV